jgi:hypothetical protein
VPNKFLVMIGAADQGAANQRLETAIVECEYDDDCGILPSMRCIDTSDDITVVLQRISAKLQTEDRLVIAPVGSPWAAYNAPTMEDCGRLTSQVEQKTGVKQKTRAS